MQREDQQQLVADGDRARRESSRPSRPPRRRRSWLTAVAVLALLAGLLATTGYPSSTGPALAQTLPAEAADFASEVYGNPWDFADAADTSGMIVEHSNGSSHPTYSMPTPSGGNLAVSMRAQSQLYLVREWGAGALSFGKHGPTTPIDADRYRWVSFEATVNQNIHGAVRWRTCTTGGNSCDGARTFAMSPGRKRYSIPVHLGSNLPPLTAAWSGSVRQLLVIPNADKANVTVTFHWIRVHEGPATLSHQWVPGPPEPVQAGWPAIQARPRPVVIDPDLAGGQEDYATTVRGDPWDMAEMSDVARYWHATLELDNGNIRGETAGPIRNDPAVELAAPVPINTRRWHRLSLRVHYAGEFGLKNEPGGGMVGRFIWDNPNLPGIKQESNDIVVFPGNQTIVVDLHTDPPSAVNDDEIPYRLGWGAMSSMVVTNPRWDPHEDPGHRVWWIEDVRLARNDIANPTFRIRFRDGAHQPGTTAKLSLVGARGQSGGIPLHAASLSVLPGENWFDLDARTLPRQGTFWVRLELIGPTGITSTAWSTGPVETGTPVEFTDVDPRGPFFTAVTWLVKSGIAKGYDADHFGSVSPVSRQAMAAFLARIDGGSSGGACQGGGVGPFGDVGVAHMFCSEIRWLVDEGIATGYQDGGFHPTAAVSRQAMAAFLYRSIVGGNPPACTSKPFPDVAVDSPFCGHVRWLATSGIASGYQDGGFHPAAPVSRQAMAAFLHRADQL